MENHIGKHMDIVKATGMCIYIYITATLSGWLPFSSSFCLGFRGSGSLVLMVDILGRAI